MHYMNEQLVLCSRTRRRVFLEARSQEENEQKIKPGRCDSRQCTAVPHGRTDRTASSRGNEELGGKIKASR
jgi:hypothetical protein